MLNRLLASIVQTGTLRVTAPDGHLTRFGKGDPEIGLRFHDRRGMLELGANPELKLGELYMDGRITVEDGDIADLLDLLMHNLSLSSRKGVLRVTQAWRRVTRWIAQRNHSLRARRNVAHHYDLSGKLYDIFLDSDRQYSCAYFSEPGETLEEA
jgi:cyclopropane-fatty-acyl-phospholipid synthase